LTLGHPVRLFALFDDGRLAVAVGGGRASLIDLASAQRIASLRAPLGADQLVFSASFAYAVDRKLARAMMWSLSDLRAGRDTSAEVMLGRADDASAENTQNFETAVPSADGKGLIAASRTDGMLYQFAEGMMAPIGSYSNYRRAPLSLAVLDLSLRETEPGRYVTTLKHRKGGSYELILGGIGPSFSSCSNLDLPAVENDDGTLEERIVAALVSIGPPNPGPGRRQKIEVRLERRGTDGQPSVLVGVADLMVLVFDRLNGWQTRVPLRETGEGKYVAHINVPREGHYELHASSVSKNISFAQGRIGSVSLGASP
jgi:hypothetical protein